MLQYVFVLVVDFCLASVAKLSISKTDRYKKPYSTDNTNNELPGGKQD